MTFTKIAFSTMEEFFAIMRKTRLNFVLFGSEEHTRLADAFVLEENEAGYYVNVRELKGECFDRLMRNSAVELRATPGLAEIKALPHIRSFIPGEGFVDTYFENEKRDIGKFLERSRAAKSGSR
jgi:hypothetical protein